jgi:hypothetical protein
MPDPIFIPGYLGTVVLNSEDLSIIGHVVSLDGSRDTLTKKVFGQTHAFTIGGQRIEAFSASGSISAEKIAALEAAYQTQAAVAFSMQIGEAAGATDGGVYTGNCIIGSRRIEGNAEGQWTWNITAQASGVPVYTPAAAS